MLSSDVSGGDHNPGLWLVRVSWPLPLIGRCWHHDIILDSRLTSHCGHSIVPWRNLHHLYHLLLSPQEGSTDGGCRRMQSLLYASISLSLDNFYTIFARCCKINWYTAEHSAHCGSQTECWELSSDWDWAWAWDGKWEMENGKWNMEHGTWNMEHGKWKMENGKWKMENGKWKKRVKNCE